MSRAYMASKTDYWSNQYTRTEAYEKIAQAKKNNSVWKAGNTKAAAQNTTPKENIATKIMTWLSILTAGAGLVSSGVNTYNAFKGPGDDKTK